MATTRPRKNRAHDAVELRPLADDHDGLDDDDGYEKKSKMDQWLQYILQKLHALLWIIVACALAAYTQVFEVIVDGHPPARPQAELNRCVRSPLALVCAAARISQRRRNSRASFVCAGSGSTSGWPASAAGC